MSRPISSTQVLTALARVVHPEQKRDIVQLTMVQDAAIIHGVVSFSRLSESRRARALIALTPDPGVAFEYSRFERVEQKPEARRLRVGSHSSKSEPAPAPIFLQIPFA